MAKGLAEFVQFLERDEASRKVLEEVSREKKGRALDEAIVALAARAGFSVTVAELEKAIEDRLAGLLVGDAEGQELEDLVAEKQGCFAGWVVRRLLGTHEKADPGLA